MTRIRDFTLALAVLTIVTAFGQVAEPPRERAEPTRFEIPAADEGLPGAGPLRRADWFKKLWAQRRAAWSIQMEQDKNAVVFLGDSITQGWGDKMGGVFEAKVANRGISGDTTRGVLIRLDEDVLALKPRGVVLLIGTNDLEEQAEPQVIASNLKLILEKLKKHNPKMPILLCEVFPSSESKKRPAGKIKEVNKLYAALANRDPQVKLVKTWQVFANAEGDARPEEFPDLLHPNEAGYTKWAQTLRPAMEDADLITR